MSSEPRTAALTPLDALRREMYLPAHKHSKGTESCVGCDLLQRLNGKTLAIEAEAAAAPRLRADADEAWRLLLEHQDAVHADLVAIMAALGIADYARPYSHHEVVVSEILPAIAALDPNNQKPPLFRRGSRAKSRSLSNPRLTHSSTGSPPVKPQSAAAPERAALDVTRLARAIVAVPKSWEMDLRTEEAVKAYAAMIAAAYEKSDG